MKDIVIEIEDYKREITLSQARRAKRREDGTISNPRTVGKPRIMVLNGQNIWVGMSHFVRAKIASELKLYFYEKFREVGMKRISPKSYPLEIGIHFEGPEAKFDLDNYSIFYRKSIQDALCGNVKFDSVINEKTGRRNLIPDRENYPPLIEDDNVKFIQSIPCSYTISDKRKLKIIIKQLKQ